MFEQQLHDIVVRLVGCNVERSEELLVLVVQVAPLSEIRDFEIEFLHYHSHCNHL